MRTAIRLMILGVSVVATLVVGAAAFGAAGVWALLAVRGRDFVLDSRSVALWPESWTAVDVYAWGAPLYLVAAVVLALVVLPLTLALLERAYLALRP